MAQPTQEQLEPIKAGIDEAKKRIAEISKGITSLSIPKTPIPEIDMSKAPALPVDTTDITTGIAGTLAQLQGTIGQITEAIKGLKPTIPTEATTPKGALATLTGLLGKRQEERAAMPSLVEQYKTARDEVFNLFGMTPEVFQQQQALVGQLTEYKKQIDALEAEKQQRLLGAEQQYQGRLTDLLRGEQGLIERQYNSKIAAKSAEAATVLYQYQLQQGQIDKAMAMVDKIVQLKTYDYEQRLKDFDWAYNTYKDVISMWSAEEQREWEKQYRTLEAARDEAYRKNQLELEKMRIELERERIGISKGEKVEKVNVPTVYGLTPTQARDVLYSPTVPDWFQQQIQQEFRASLQPTVMRNLWEAFKKQAIEKHKEVKELMQPTSGSFESWREQFE